MSCTASSWCEGTGCDNRARAAATVSNPAVAEAAAIGVPHDVKGNAIHAFVVLRMVADERPEVVGQPCNDHGRPFGRARLDCFDDVSHPEFLPFGIEGLGHAISVKDETIVGLERHGR